MNDMTVAPARADMAATKASTSEVTRTPLPAATITPKPVPMCDKRRCGLRSQSMSDDHLLLSFSLTFAYCGATG